MVVMVLGAGFWVNFDGAWRVSGGGSQWFVCLFRDKASGLRCYIYILLEVCVGDFYEGFCRHPRGISGLIHMKELKLQKLNHFKYRADGLYDSQNEKNNNS